MKDFNPALLGFCAFFILFFYMSYDVLSVNSYIVDYSNVSFGTPNVENSERGGWVVANENSTLTKIIKDSQNTATNCYVRDSNQNLLGSGTFSGINCTLTVPVNVTKNVGYALYTDCGGGSCTYVYGAPAGGFPIVRTNFNYLGGSYQPTNSTDTTNLLNIAGIESYSNITLPGITIGFGEYTYNYTNRSTWGSSRCVGAGGYEDHNFYIGRALTFSYIDVIPMPDESACGITSQIIGFIGGGVNINLSAPSGVLSHIPLNVNISGGNILTLRFYAGFSKSQDSLTYPIYFNSSVTNQSEGDLYEVNSTVISGGGSCGGNCNSMPVNYISIIAYDQPALVQSILSSHCSIGFQNESALYNNFTYECSLPVVDVRGCDNVTSAQICTISNFYNCAGNMFGSFAQINNSGTAFGFTERCYPNATQIISCGAEIDLSSYVNSDIGGWCSYGYSDPSHLNLQNMAVYTCALNLMCVRNYDRFVNNCSDICVDGRLLKGGNYDFNTRTCSYNTVLQCRLGCSSINTCDTESGFTWSPTLPATLNVSDNSHLSRSIGFYTSSDMVIFLILTLISLPIIRFIPDSKFVLFIVGSLKAMFAISGVVSGAVLLSAIFDIVMGIAKYMRSKE